MSELLAPAGSVEAFFAAINAGADAIYVGLNTFSARAYANNFSVEELKELVAYAHLRNVKIFITMNTIVFQDELVKAYALIDELANIPVDALIIQDLALINYVTKKYPHIEAHVSTQMGIDDLEGIKVLEGLGVKRIVLAREVPIDKIKDLKSKTTMPLEAFIHGALCVSYSGNCLMSGLIGMRSGNRGRCVGSCRKLYNLVNLSTDFIFPKQYLLSMKDLNTTEHINDLRMRAPCAASPTTLSPTPQHSFPLQAPSQNKLKLRQSLSQLFHWLPSQILHSSYALGAERDRWQT